MKNYLIRRILLFIPVLFLFSVLLFVMLRVMPGDVVALYMGLDEFSPPLKQEEADKLKHELGFDRPLYVQYGEWLGNTVTGDLGHALSAGRKVNTVIKEKLPVSLQLGIMALLFAYCVSIPGGIAMAIKQNTVPDYVIRMISILGLAMPTFWVGIVIILVLSRMFGWLPPVAYVQFWDNPATNLTQMIWPAVAAGSSSMAFSSRIVRSSMLEVLRQDYMRTAVAKGLAPMPRITRHALRNALIPVITLLGVQIAHIASGSVIVEVLFGLPGLGRELLRAISLRDFPLVQGIVVALAGWVLVVNLIVDVLYGFIDPRVKYS